MRKSIAFGIVGSVVLAATAAAQAPSTSPTHTVVTPDTLTWGEGPPALPKGGLTALLSGDPTGPGSYTLRAKLPAGYTIPPHWHPTDEHLTVISGELAVGMGDTFDAASMKTMGPGAYAVMPADMRHYVRVKVPTILQVHGTGPFMMTYVNPADDPRRGARAK